MWENDAKQVAEALKAQFSAEHSLDWDIVKEPPAVRIIDCVLSLRKNYRNTVWPRVVAFRDAHPEVRSCADLRAFVDAAPDPTTFMSQSLRMKSPGKGAAILGVTTYLIEMQKRFEGATEEDRLTKWATWARPGDYLSVGVAGFGLAGFQYLRMLFGADTAKPDVHVIRFVSNALNRKVKEIHALYILERAAELSGQSLQRVDNAIWKRGAIGRT